MSWFTPILLTHDERSAGLRTPRSNHVVIEAANGLGSARASSQWAWSSTPAQPATATSATARRPAREGASLRVPMELLSQMSEAARALGRSESEVWVEAAREWLRRRETEPSTPPAAPARGVATRRPVRVWDDIDALLIELRAPTITLPEQEGVPAA